MNVEALHNKLREARLKLKCHALRKDESYLNKTVQQLRGKKEERKTKKKWEDCLKQDMAEMQLKRELCKTEHFREGSTPASDPT